MWRAISATTAGSGSATARAAQAPATRAASPKAITAHASRSAISMRRGLCGWASMRSG